MDHLKNLNNGIKKFEEYGDLFNKVSNMNHILCRAYGIEGYTINLDGSIDIRREEKNNKYRISGFYLSPVKFKHYRFEIAFETNNTVKIPVKFNRVEYSFYCSDIGLETLENSPQYVTGNFDCSGNKLTTLKGGPNNVGGGFFCENNNLKDVYGFPQFFYGDIIDISKNPVFEVICLIVGDTKVLTKTQFLNKEIKFIRLLNDYNVIRNGDTIIQDRLEEALDEVDIKLLHGKFEITQEEFKNYKLI